MFARLKLDASVLLQKNPTTLVSVLSVSTRQPSKDGADSFGDPVTMMTMLTCNSEAATQDLLQKLKGEKAGK